MKDRQDTGSQPTKRVFKSSDVHKRRVDPSVRARSKKSAASANGAADERAAAQNAESIAPSPSSSNASLDASGRTSRIRMDAAETQAIEQVRETKPSQTAAQARVPEQAEQVEDAEQSQEPPKFTAMKGDKRPTQRTPRQRPARQRPTAQPQANETVESERATERADAASKETEPSSDAKRLQLPAAPRRSTIAIAGVAVLAVLLVFAGVFAFNRWMRYDDHADLQGTWYILNTDVPITIDDEYIHFNDEVSYRYTIDPAEKTMHYTFGPMEGQGRYWFSDDRAHLVITDGDSFTAAGTTVDDLMHAFIDFSTASSGEAVELPSGDGIIAFSREPEVGLTDEQIAQKAEEQAFRERAGNPTVDGLVVKSFASGLAALEWSWENALYGYGSYYGYYYDNSYDYTYDYTADNGAYYTDYGSYYDDGTSYYGEQTYQDQYYGG